MQSSFLTVIIHTYNSSTDIVACIGSARLLTDTIAVVDMESSDETVKIAQQLSTHAFNFPRSHYVEPARQFGIEKAETEWVFILDADERITPELAQEVKKEIANCELRIANEKQDKFEKNCTYYKIPRKNIFGRTKWLKYGGWWPDYQIRLINKKYFKTWPKEIHSTPVIEGDLGYLNNPLLHYFHGDFIKMVEKTVLFEDIESELLFKAGRKSSTTIFFRKFFGELYRRLVKWRGFLDGEVGIMESIYQAYSKTITYLYLYEKKQNRG